MNNNPDSIRKGLENDGFLTLLMVKTFKKKGLRVIIKSLVNTGGYYV